MKKHTQQKATRKERGAALIIALLLLLILTGMTVAMVLSNSSDMLINGYYRNFRGSFYAADSGLSIARQAMVNQVLAVVPATLTSTTQPIATGTQSSVVSSINGTYGSYTSLNTGGAANSWPEQFKLDTTKTSLTLASCTVLGGGGTCAAPTGTPTGYQYLYNYTLTAFGQSRGTESAVVDDAGSFTFTATLVPSGGTKTSFAAWGMFIDQYSECAGGTLVPGTISGPVFTNGAWTFSDAGSYIFTDQVGSASSTAGYSFSGGPCNQVAGASSSYRSGSTTSTIAPTFQAGLNLGEPSIPLPVNDYSQKRAAIDGQGSNTAAVTNSDLNAAMKNISETPYPTTGASSGVYLPYTVNATTGVATLTGGGIYVEGSASVTLSTSGTSGQVYTIKQGSTTTTITVNNSTNTTTVVSGGTTLNIVGVPQVKDPTTGAVTGNGTMLYVDGSITALTGPGQGVPAVQDGTALTITAASNVTITGDILYKTEPVTLTQNQIPGTPADTLISGNNNGQALGIFTSTGQIQLANAQSNGNLEIDASIAAISSGGSGGLVNTGNAINTLNIVGGRIQNQIENINTTTRNVFFDRRYATGGFSPPWYPSTTVTASSTDTATMTTTVQRTNWFNRTTY